MPNCQQWEVRRRIQVGMRVLGVFSAKEGKVLEDMAIPGICSMTIRRVRAGAGMLLFFLLCGNAARADGLLGLYTVSPNPYGSYLFPNWIRAPVTAFSIWECDDLTCSTCINGTIAGLTIFNYGSATGGAGGDLTSVYFKIDCGDNLMALQTMVYRGIWTVGAFTGPAWTWSGSLAWTVDSCRTPTQSPDGCGCLPQLTLYADVSTCPTDGATVEFGTGFDPSTTIYAGGMTDLKGTGRIVAMASTENTLSAEYASLSNGEFTYYMVDKGMIDYLADKYDDLSDDIPDVTIEESWDYAKLFCRYDSITISDNFTNDLLP